MPATPCVPQIQLGTAEISRRTIRESARIWDYGRDAYVLGIRAIPWFAARQRALYARHDERHAAPKHMPAPARFTRGLHGSVWHLCSAA